jgi:putrescine transport system ATP-binding protein
VLLLDEPLGALDKKLREETQFELMDLQQHELGLTFLVVTHDQEEAMTVADRIGGDGSRAGSFRSRDARPRSTRRRTRRYVAEFIGDINLFEGKIGDDAERA